MINIKVNGDTRSLEDNVSLLELIEKLKLSGERVAVEVNKDVVRRIDWGGVILSENDTVEIIHFVGGG